MEFNLMLPVWQAEFIYTELRAAILFRLKR
jgi:hypothetical protein